MKKQNGITLLALIITIIIMLILAGVTISIVGGSDGIVAKAEKAVSQTDKAAMQEDAELSIAAIKMDYYEDYGANRAKYLNAKAFIVDYLKNEYKTSRGATMVADSAGNVTYTYKSVATKVTLADDGSVTLGESSNGGTVTPEVPDEPDVPIIPTGLEIGDTVSYSPSGTYNWQAKYASSDLSDNGSADVALSSASGEAYNITTWKVFSIDETTGKVELVPSAATTGTVRLQGAQGYNNAVKLLNDTCSSLYGDSSKGITARSVNFDDLENVMYYEEEGMNFVEYYDTYIGPDTYSQDENYQAKTAYSANKKYPTIYEQEDLSTITYDGAMEETKVAVGSGLGISEQTSLIGRTAAGLVSGDTSSEGFITTATSIRPYGTYRYVYSTEFSELLGDYASIVLPSGTSTSYWVASRCVYANSSNCDFYVAGVYSGNLRGGNLCNSLDDALNISRALFPVVSLSSELLSEGSTTEWSVQ